MAAYYQNDTKLAGGLLLASGVVFLIFNTIAEGIYPNYSVRTNALSDLGALGAPTAFLWNAQLFATGVLGLLGMYVLFFKSSWSKTIKRRNLTGILFVLPTIGIIIVSLFPENFVGAIHLFGAIMNFSLGGISAIYAYRLTTSPFRYFSLAMGAVSFVATNLLGISALFGFGLVERMVVYPFAIWLIAFGSYLMAPQRAN